MILSNSTKLYLASDGSALNFVGTFGWAANKNTKTLIANNSRAAPDQ